MTSLILRDRDLEVLRRTLDRFPFVQKAVLFGSRATGNARRASDIDLAIYAPNATTAEWLELSDAFDAVPIIYELDLVRMERLSNQRLIEKITRDGVAIYPETVEA